MAPPPKYVISRKLVKRFFDKYLPRKPMDVQNESGKLMKCWQQFGIDDPRCKEYEVLYDHMYTQTKDYRKKIEGLRIKEDVMGALLRPKYSNELKGRWRTGKTTEWTIYDGVK